MLGILDVSTFDDDVRVDGSYDLQTHVEHVGLERIHQGKLVRFACRQKLTQLHNKEKKMNLKNMILDLMPPRSSGILQGTHVFKL